MGSKVNVTPMPASRCVMKSRAAMADAPALAAPTQPKTLSTTAVLNGSERLSIATIDISKALQAKYTAPKTITTITSMTPRSLASSAQNSMPMCSRCPQAHMLTAAMVALPRRVVQRLVLRHEDTSASSAAATQPASGPWASSSSTMKTSPTEKTWLVRGIFNGNSAVTMASTTPPAICQSAYIGNCATLCSAAAKQVVPTVSISHQ